jgi:hypothetical protein
MKTINLLQLYILVIIINVFCLTGLTQAHEYVIEPKDCCCERWVDCIARPTATDPRCMYGHKRDSSYDCWIDTDDLFRCGGWLVYQACQLDPTCGYCGVVSSEGECTPDIATGTVPEVPNGIDDDCDGVVDDEQCDNIDNDNNGMVDDSRGSCLIKVLFVAFNWEDNGNAQDEFDRAVETQWSDFLNIYKISPCMHNYWIKKLTVAEDNIQVECIDNGDNIITAVRDYIRNKYGEQTIKDYNQIVAITNQNVCWFWAGMHSGSFIWLEANSGASTLAHEIGHGYGLEDEYCSNQAGSTNEYCNDGGIPADYDGDGTVPEADINFLGDDLGCDPRDLAGCCIGCGIVNYGSCCSGNRNTLWGRCTMASAGAAAPRTFCNRCEMHISSKFTNCTDVYDGHSSIADMTFTLTQDGKMVITDMSTGLGRLGFGVFGTTGTYGIELWDKQGRRLHKSAYNESFRYNGPVLPNVAYPNTKFDKITRLMRIPLEVSQTGPIKVVASKQGIITSQFWLHPSSNLPNNIVKYEVDNTPPIIHCTLPLNAQN